ncbi:hypothetical protein ACP275_13G152500 [Erythranthe tilingii]
MSFVDEETIDSLSKDSLFSAIITLYTILLIYSPSLLLQFFFSPVVFSTLILLLYLLRLGAVQNSAPAAPIGSDSGESLPLQIEEFVDPDHHNWASNTGANHNPHRFYEESFVEWDVRAPLEVIYEEYDEGEDARENDVVSEAKKKSDMNIIQRYASLSLFYPESDSDCSSDGDSPTGGGWDSPEKMCFRWEDEDDREGLIEIALDGKRNGEVDEENLIEIDLFPAR